MEGSMAGNDFGSTGATALYTSKKLEFLNVAHGDGAARHRMDDDIVAAMLDCIALGVADDEAIVALPAKDPNVEPNLAMFRPGGRELHVSRVIPAQPNLEGIVALPAAEEIVTLRRDQSVVARLSMKDVARPISVIGAVRNEVRSISGSHEIGAITVVVENETIVAFRSTPSQSS
jgi:hypothetical protein